jgi:transcriptional regulator with XRE-family HTH domain
VAKRKDPLLRALGSRVRRLREAKGWTQEGLAERSGLDRSYIAGIEAGLRNPSIKALAKITRGLGATLSGFFDTVG